MSDTKNTAITFDSLLPGISLSGIAVIEQSAFYKIAKDKKAMYIAKTKRSVTRIDISGFTVTHPAVSPPKKKNGKVTGQIQMSHPLALEAVAIALTHVTDAEVKGNKVS